MAFNTLTMLYKHHHYHTNPLQPCMFILFQTHVRTCLHHNFFFPDGSLQLPITPASLAVPWMPLFQLHLETLYLLLFFKLFMSFVSTLLLSASRMFVSLPAPTAASQGQRWIHVLHAQRHLGIIFAFLLSGYSNNN